jgi:multimeric flavodoxin WrbA
MKILAIIGSYRRNGNTDQIVGLIRTHLQKEADQAQTPLEIETIYLGQQDLHFCRGCRICFDRGEEHCPVKDDLPGLKARMLSADGVLMASPVYVDDVSGMIKTLIDRLCHVCHRPQFAGKVAYLVATTGDSRTGKTLETMSMSLRTWGFHIAGQMGFKMGALMKHDETLRRYDAQAALAARRLFTALSRQSYRWPSFFSLMMFKIQQRAWQAKLEPDSLDYRYWQQMGWLDPQKTFYFPHRAGGFKVALARLTGIVIGNLVT